MNFIHVDCEKEGREGDSMCNALKLALIFIFMMSIVDV